MAIARRVHVVALAYSAMELCPAKAPGALCEAIEAGDEPWSKPEPIKSILAGQPIEVISAVEEHAKVAVNVASQPRRQQSKLD